MWHLDRGIDSDDPQGVGRHLGYEQDSKKQTAVIFIFLVVYGMLPVNSNENDQNKISWAELPPLPNELGVAGPFVGVHRERLIVAGGANFLSQSGKIKSNG